MPEEEFIDGYFIIEQRRSGCAAGERILYSDGCPSSGDSLR
ncbi:MAG: hypothetical protein ACLRSW_13320 [Christensenellaceae bacterium]